MLSMLADLQIFFPSGSCVLFLEVLRLKGGANSGSADYVPYNLQQYATHSENFYFDSATPTRKAGTRKRDP